MNFKKNEPVMVEHNSYDGVFPVGSVVIYKQRYDAVTRVMDSYLPKSEKRAAYKYFLCSQAYKTTDLRPLTDEEFIEYSHQS